MKVYFYVKTASGNCERRGGVEISLPTSDATDADLVAIAKQLSGLVDVQTLCTQEGDVPCEASEYDEQLLNGAKA